MTWRRGLSRSKRLPGIRSKIRGYDIRWRVKKYIPWRRHKSTHKGGRARLPRSAVNPAAGSFARYTLILWVRAREKIIIAPGINVWPHELKTAEAFAAAGYTVEFIRRSEERFATSADCIINGTVWEMKSPTTNSKRRIQRTLRDALAQSHCVIFDSRRMKGLPDKAVEQELRKWAPELKSLKHLIFVGRGGVVIDIK